VDHHVNGFAVDLGRPSVVGDIALDPTQLVQVDASRRRRSEVYALNSLDAACASEPLYEHRPNIACGTRDEDIHVLVPCFFFGAPESNYASSQPGAQSCGSPLRRFSSTRPLACARHRRAERGPKTNQFDGS
jgi:hypothetical protein